MIIKTAQKDAAHERVGLVKEELDIIVKSEKTNEAKDLLLDSYVSSCEKKHGNRAWLDGHTSTHTFNGASEAG